MARGFTLIESLLVLAIVALLVSAASGLDTLLERERRVQAVLDLRRSLSFARTAAVNRQLRITLCALDAQADCAGSWQGRDFAIFVDRNRNRRLDDGEALRREHWSASRGQLTWRAALGRSYLVFKPGGDTAQNGSFLYCPQVGDKRRATRVVINRAGRHYVADEVPQACG